MTKVLIALCLTAATAAAQEAKVTKLMTHELAGMIAGKEARPDDTLHLDIEVLAVRPSKSRPDQGVIKVKTTTLNQNNQPVQVAVGNLIVRRRLLSTG